MAVYKIWETTVAYRSCYVEADSQEEAERIWGWSPEKLYGYSDWEVSDGEDIDEVEEVR